MGMCLEKTPAMGEYNAEVRRESFYLHGEDSRRDRARHAIFVYPNGETGQGTAEILIEDIPKIRAVLDEIERYVASR